MSCGDDGRPDLMAEHPAAKGLAALRKGDFAGALAHFDDLVRREPAGVPGHFLRVEALDRAGDRAGARAALLDLVVRFPFAEAACRERLAILALRDGDLPQALASLKRALETGWTYAEAVTSEPAFAAFADDGELRALLDEARRAASAPAR